MNTKPVLVETYQPIPLENVSPVLRLSFAEDALAIASWAESMGFVEDARNMRDFSQRIRPVFGVNRWAHKRVTA